MIGEDSVEEFIKVLRKILSFSSRFMQESVNIANYIANSGRKHNSKERNNNQPKIIFGKISKKNFEKMIKDGTEFNYISVPKDKLDEFARTVRALGGGAFFPKWDFGNTGVAAIPKGQMEAANMALQIIVGNTLKGNPESIKVNKGNDKLTEAEMKMASYVMGKADVPSISFKSKDGNYINVIPKEFEGQYEKIANEVKKSAKELKNIEVTRFEQNAKTADLTAQEITYDAALALEKSPADVKFANNNGKIIAVYSEKDKDIVKAAIEKDISETQKTESCLISITDDFVSMDKESLLVSEDEKSFFLKIPNTSGQDYISLNKSDCDIKGREILTAIDANKTYNILDKDGNFKGEKVGSELKKLYNVKYKHANKDTEIMQFGEMIPRIELFNKADNKIIGVGIEKAEKVYSYLLDGGFNPSEAKKLLKSINENLSKNDKLKKILAYEDFGKNNDKKITFSDISDVENLLVQSKILKSVKNKEAKYIGEENSKDGSKVLVYDKNKNEYTIMNVMMYSKVYEKLCDMGYDDITAKGLADKVTDSYSNADIEKLDVQKDERVKTENLESNNFELKNMSFARCDDGIILMQETENDYNYAHIARDANVQEIYNAVFEGFDVKDGISVAEVVSCLAKQEAVSPLPEVKAGEVIMAKVTPSHFEVRKDGQSCIIDKSNINMDALTKIGLTAKEAKNIIKFSEKFPEKSILSKIAENVKKEKESDKSNSEAKEKNTSERKADNERGM